MDIYSQIENRQEQKADKTKFNLSEISSSKEEIRLAFDRILKNYNSQSLKETPTDLSTSRYFFKVIEVAKSSDPCSVFSNNIIDKNIDIEIEGSNEIFRENTEFYIKESNELIEGNGQYYVNINNPEYVQILEKKVVTSGFCINRPDDKTNGNNNDDRTDGNTDRINDRFGLIR